MLFLTAFAGLFGLFVFASAQTRPERKAVLLAGPSRDEVVINQRPLRDLGQDLKNRIEARSVDLDTPFSVELTGVLEKSGKLDPATVKYQKAEGGKEIVDAVKKAIEAINDSGYFAYLSRMEPEGPVIIRAAQDASEFNSSLSVEMSTANKARTLASVFQMMIVAARQNAENKIGLDKDVRPLLNSTTISSEDKSFVIKIGMPKSSFREMIEPRLSDLKNAPQS